MLDNTKKVFLYFGFISILSDNNGFKTNTKATIHNSNITRITIIIDTKPFNSDAVLAFSKFFSIFFCLSSFAQLLSKYTRTYVHICYINNYGGVYSLF